MKRLAMIALTLAACSSTDAQTMQPVFSDWQKALVDGKFDYIYSHTSVTLKSRWLYDLFASGNQVALEANKKLTKEMADDFDHWYVANRREHSPGMIPTALPATLARSPWLEEVLRASFKNAQPGLKGEFNALQFKDARIDQDKATIMVENRHGRPEAFEIVKEDGIWKWNYWKPGPPK